MISLRCLATGRTLTGPQANPRCSLKSPTMGEEGGGRSCGTTRELQKLKQQALEYYRENDVPRRLEELLNSTFYLQPADVYGHLVGTWDRNPLPSSPSPPPRSAAMQCACAVESRTRAAAAGGRGVVVVQSCHLEERSRAETWAQESRERESGGLESARGKRIVGGFVATATAQSLAGVLVGSPASCLFNHRT